IQATIQTVTALAPQLKVLTDPMATSDNVVNTLQHMLPAEHIETLAWAALNDPATQQVIFDDPEVIQAIEQRYFQGRSLDEVQQILADVPGDIDPATANLRREVAAMRAEKDREVSQARDRAIAERTQGLMNRFFEMPAQQVIAGDFKLVAPEGAT